MLHVEVTGQGAPLVLIHGWGMHGGMWGEAVPALARYFRVYCVDLPGHGNSPDGEAVFTLDGVADSLSAAFDVPVHVCGWSLGGQIALRWARRSPQQVRKLTLVASTPCFAEREDWPSGMATDTLRQFAADLERDHAATLRRFLALQVRGSENERALLAELRARLSSCGEPRVEALRGGLAILRDEDLRAELSGVRQPALLIAGGRDRLTPPEASRWMARALPAAQLVEIDGAAHAPFLSHPDLFFQHVTEFLHG